MPWNLKRRLWRFSGKCCSNMIVASNRWPDIAARCRMGMAPVVA
jgi:hypothetical protein